MRIAAVIPVYNRPGVALEAVRSALAQTRSPSWLIVVDDGSSDDTADRVEAFLARTRPPIEWRVVRQSNQGPAAARNRGVAEAGDCDAIAFLDSDDLWPTDYLARMNAALGRREDAVAATADRLNVDLTTGRQTMRRCDGLAARTTEHLFVFGPPGTPNTVIRRWAFERCGGYDPSLRTGEDYHLLLRLSLLGPWLHVPGAAVTVRRGIAEALDQAQQTSKALDDRRLIRSRMLDRFIFEEGGRDRVPQRLWRKRLGRMWYSAGRQLRGLGRSEEARQCFERAARVNPCHVRARAMLLLTS